MVRWQGGGFSDVIAPVFDMGIGLTPQVQFGASIPRTSDGLGTTFFSAKIAAASRQDVSLAVAPTLEVRSASSMAFGPAGQSRTQWGLPVSVHFDRENGRLYGSSGYFSPGIWYAGLGYGESVTDRLSMSASFSRAWSTAPAAGLSGRTRNDLSGSAAYHATDMISLFGSIGRTLGTATQEGGGTTLGFGMSISADTVFRK
jgi:hypothetical protein